MNQGCRVFTARGLHAGFMILLEPAAEDPAQKKTCGWTPVKYNLAPIRGSEPEKKICSNNFDLSYHTSYIIYRYLEYFSKKGNSPSGKRVINACKPHKKILASWLKIITMTESFNPFLRTTI